MIDFDKFAEIIIGLDLLHEQEDRINHILNDPLYDIVHNDFISGAVFGSPIMEQWVIDLLEGMFNDAEDHWISYFIFELDYGRKWKPGMITDINGEDIQLQSVKDLWEFLNDNNEL